MKIQKILTLYLLIFISTTAYTADGWHLSSFMGASKSFNNTLSIHLEDKPDQVINANYSNRSFDDSHWWAFRLENWTGQSTRGFELIHHKIYLSNTNDVVTEFSISDGYNLLYYNFGRRYNRHVFRFGAGIVIGHPDITIEGRNQYVQKGFRGHRFAGPSVQFNYENWLWENNSHFVSFDSKLTLSYAKVPISNNSNEYATAPDIAVHFSLGFGSKPSAFKEKGIKKALYFSPFIYPALVGNFILGTSVFPSK